MIIEKTDIAIVFRDEKMSVSEFFSDFSKNYTTFKDKNIILDFSLNKGVDIENILLFLPIIGAHTDNGMSFVIVLNEIEVNDFPDEINVVPTLVEAKDIVGMENIERDLGF